MWTLTADTVIGDDPVLLRSLKNAEVHAQSLTEENSRLREKLERYENEYGIIYDMNDGGSGESDEEEVGGRGGDAHAEHGEVGLRSRDDDVLEVMDAVGRPAKDSLGSEEETGSDEEVVEMVVTHGGGGGGGDGETDPYLLAGNGPAVDGQEPQQDERGETGDEAELEPEPVPAPRRSRRTRRA